ncbi:uncharacterized protein PHALS_01637 [Plasmopara halstedii]|uniref:Uncharacterized protein n=1 Tax=Plasmopara halstedii TaxID=4781 RepID=A0A0P1AWD6_PLAHL|nr:uncharacterized protein PHALS_01637 [Plasmopara halstedii]CEG45333.1 hypothetical protein PHALS_01637 [Plasmopara halstedii]|eukprot:XP_024581702.1 hypothetical protein PHALS_01637 [Plasmopara halstedii]
MHENDAHDLSPPQCSSAMRLHEMLLEGNLGEYAEHALQSSRHFKDQYQSLRACDDYYDALVNSNNNVAASQDRKKAAWTSYSAYLDCIGKALCEKPLLEWKACISSVKIGKKHIQECAQTKRLLERCLRSKSEEILRASQPQVFRPNAVP